MPDRLVTMSLCGDVMLGRGVDQILPHPGSAALREAQVSDAEFYVGLAEATSGPIPRPVSFSWPWGVVVEMLGSVDPDLRLVNLETSVTRCDRFWPGKSVHYRMSPANLACLTAARPDACALANNHVLDFGHEGLAETVGSLALSGSVAVGAGMDLGKARRPAVVAMPPAGRVLVFSFGLASSGIPASWAATDHRPGVSFISEPSSDAADEIVDTMRAYKEPGDLVVASIHWGTNWGYRVPPDQVRFAHRLVDAGVDVIHGHSSHHPRPIEVYRGKLILYGCGDFIDDYEGIAGYGRYRDDLRLMYLAEVAQQTGRLASLRMAPLRARKMRLEHASRRDSAWLRALLDRISRGFGVRVDLEPTGLIARGA